MTPQDQETLRLWAQDRKRTNSPVELAMDDSSAAGQLDLFFQELGRKAKFLTLKKTTDPTWCKPALIIGPHRNIAYQAVPQALELQVFLEALTEDELGTSHAKETEQLAAAIRLPAELTLYISSACPHCPQAVRSLTRIAHTCELLRLAIVDVDLMPEQAQTDQIRSVPTLLLEKQMRWTGVPDTEEVLSMCLNRDPAAISPGSLRMLLESGDAGRAAGMMAEHGKVFPALIDLLCNPLWSVRLGAMVTAEYLAEENPTLAGQLVEPLWLRFEGLDEQNQGDVAHILGQIRAPAALERLRQIAVGPYADEVKQAAGEALVEAEEP